MWGNKGVISKAWGRTPAPPQAGIFRPVAGSVYAPNMPEGRWLSKAFLLADNRVLILGGSRDTLSRSRQGLIYTPLGFGVGNWAFHNYNWTWFDVNSGFQYSPVALQLADYRIFVGAPINQNIGLKFGFLDPLTLAWSLVAACPLEFSDECAVCEMWDGRIVVGGGRKMAANTRTWTNAGQMAVYDPSDNTWSIPAAVHAIPGVARSAVLDNDGKVLFIGGTNIGGTNADGQRWDPWLDTVTLYNRRQFQNWPGVGRTPGGYVIVSPCNSFTTNDPWDIESFGLVAAPWNSQQEGTPLVNGPSGDLYSIGGRVNHPDGYNDPFISSLARIRNDGTIVNLSSKLTKTPMPYKGMFACLLGDGKTVFFGGGTGPSSTDYSPKKTCMLELQ